MSGAGDKKAKDPSAAATPPSTANNAQPTQPDVGHMAELTETMNRFLKAIEGNIGGTQQRRPPTREIKEDRKLSLQEVAKAPDGQDKLEIIRQYVQRVETALQTLQGDYKDRPVPWDARREVYIAFLHDGLIDDDIRRAASGEDIIRLLIKRLLRINKITAPWLANNVYMRKDETMEEFLSRFEKILAMGGYREDDEMLRVFIEKAGLGKFVTQTPTWNWARATAQAQADQERAKNSWGPMKAEAATPPARAEIGGRVAAAQPSQFPGKCSYCEGAGHKWRQCARRAKEDPHWQPPWWNQGGGPPANRHGTTGKGEKKYSGKGEKKYSGKGEKKYGAHAGTRSNGGGNRKYAAVAQAGEESGDSSAEDTDSGSSGSGNEPHRSYMSRIAFIKAVNEYIREPLSTEVNVANIPFRTTVDSGAGMCILRADALKKIQRTDRPVMQASCKG